MNNNRILNFEEETEKSQQSSSDESSVNSISETIDDNP